MKIPFIPLGSQLTADLMETKKVYYCKRESFRVSQSFQREAPPGLCGEPPWLEIMELSLHTDC